MTDKEKDNRVNALAMTFLEELQMRPNLFADQILRAYKTGYHQSEKDSLHSEPVRKIWHDTSEEPRLEEEVLVLRNNGTVTQVKTYQNNFGKNEYCDGMILWKLSEQKAWCYLDDLIHEKEEPVSEEWIEELHRKLDSMSKEDFKKVFDKYAIDFNEEPVSEDLDSFAIKYAQYKPYPVTVCQAVKAGAKWKEEQFEKKRLAACDRQTEEDAEIERDFVMSIIENEHRQPTFDDAIKYGMRLRKEQMMKDATEVTVHIEAGNYPYIPQMELYDYDNDVPLAKEGDKYKVVLIKEE